MAMPPNREDFGPFRDSVSKLDAHSDRLDEIEQSINLRRRKTDFYEDDRDTKGRSQWTMMKEIVGTFVGVLPFLIVVVIAWYDLKERVRVAELNIEFQRMATTRVDGDLREQRSETLIKLDRLSAQLDAAQRTITTNSETLRLLVMRTPPLR